MSDERILILYCRLNLTSLSDLVDNGADAKELK